MEIVLITNDEADAQPANSACSPGDCSPVNDGNSDDDRVTKIDVELVSN